jgi:hypothetical protein
MHNTEARKKQTMQAELGKQCSMHRKRKQDHLIRNNFLLVPMLARLGVFGSACPGQGKL